MSPIVIALINALAVLGPSAIDAIASIIKAQHGQPLTEAEHETLGKLIAGTDHMMLGKLIAGVVRQHAGP